MLSLVSRVAPTDTSVLLLGETGTGKEMVARAIHDASGRSGAPFVAVDCSGLAETLFESELFGHERGAFTGALARKSGLVEVAAGGTLFLDEVGDIPLGLQVKLLRLLETGTFRRVGGTEPLHTDFRLIAATHRDLMRQVREERFRSDLYFRISAFPVHLPPLRERRSDIPLLIEHVLSKLVHTGAKGKAHLDDQALAALRNYPFPGNVRELENILERAVALCEGDRIREDDLQLPSVDPELSAAATPLPEGDMSLESYMDEVEKKAIITALEKTRWNKTAAAKVLGITFRALRYRLKRLGLD
jgi:two-component system response regulator PilR (NtrC family)